MEEPFQLGGLGAILPAQQACPRCAEETSPCFGRKGENQGSSVSLGDTEKRKQRREAKPLNIAGSPLFRPAASSKEASNLKEPTLRIRKTPKEQEGEDFEFTDKQRFETAPPVKGDTVRQKQKHGTET